MESSGWNVVIIFWPRMQAERIKKDTRRNGIRRRRKRGQNENLFLLKRPKKPEHEILIYILD